MTKLTVKSLIACLVVLLGATAAFSQKQSVEEVVAGHLASIGSPEARAAIKSRIFQGSVVATMRIGGSGTSKGGAVMSSQGRMSLVGIIFGLQQYTNEKAAYNGRKLSLGELSPGVRTNLGGFFLTHDVIFKEGLMGGALSSAWPFLDLNSRNPKLRYAGMKKVNDRQAHVLAYEPKNGSNLEIRIYFDANNFHHLRTEYTQEFPPPPVVNPQAAARQKETRLKFTEDFSDFKVEKGLTLPHTYKMQLTFDTPNNPLLQDWVLSLTQFNFNVPLTEQQFDLTGS
ncbi:MAG: hypothetical protein QOD75_597 [Blastocatellia bacterium]|nr:hypothetical protein [Blastocatellia bacterium]